MDIESNWAKSTENRIEMFVDSYLVQSAKANVRKATERLLFSLFKKGNETQRKNLIDLLSNRCSNLTWMGKASFEFLQLIKRVFETTNDFREEKEKIIKLILEYFQ